MEEEDGSEASGYYGTKWERVVRKRCERKEKARARVRDFKTKEEVVRAACECLRKADEERKAVPIGELDFQSFKLFCGDHVEHCYFIDYYSTEKVDFFHLDDTDNSRLHKQKPEGKAGMI